MAEILTLDEKLALQEQIDSLRKKLYPSVDDHSFADEWEEVSGVHARYTPAGSLMMIKISGDSKKLRKLFSGIWKTLKPKEKLRVLSVFWSSVTFVFSSGAAAYHFFHKLAVAHGW